MAQVVNVNFRLDEDVKKSMEQACSDMGLSMSAAFTIFAKKVAREKRIPFEVCADSVYSDNHKAHGQHTGTTKKTGKSAAQEHEE